MQPGDQEITQTLTGRLPPIRFLVLPLMPSSDLAHNIGIKFLTPEEYFLGEQARPFSRDFDPAKLIGEAVLTKETCRLINHALFECLIN